MEIMFVLTKGDEVRCYGIESKAQYYADLENGWKHIATIDTFALVKHLYTSSDDEAEQAFKRIRDRTE